MNFINLQLHRRSVRHFSNKTIEIKKINNLKKVINASPTSMNGQQFSAIFIQDNKTKKILSEISGGQKHIEEAPLFVMFLADFNRIEEANHLYNNNNGFNKELEITRNTIDSLLYGFVDATIAAQGTVDAAISMDLSTCYIGAVRRNVKAIKELLDLPDHIVPVVGITIGYSENLFEIKPKINKVYNEIYNSELVKTEIKEYDIVTNEYYAQHREDNNSYTNNTISKYHFFIKSEFMADLNIVWPNNWLINNKKDAN